jgi:hypothetical protein
VTIWAGNPLQYTIKKKKQHNKKKKEEKRKLPYFSIIGQVAWNN